MQPDVSPKSLVNKDIKWYHLKKAKISNKQFLPVLILAHSEDVKDNQLQLLRPVWKNNGKTQLKFNLANLPKDGIEKFSYVDGFLKMDVSLNFNPFKKLYNFAFIEKGELSLLNRRTQKIIYSTNLFGYENNISIFTKFDPEDCLEFQHIINEKPSHLHFQLSATIRSQFDSSLKSFKAVNPLSHLFAVPEFNIPEIIIYSIKNENTGNWENYVPPRSRNRSVDLRKFNNMIVKKGEIVQTLNSGLQPSKPVAANLLNTSSIANNLSNSNLIAIDQVILAGNFNKQIRSLPIIDNVHKNFWRDRKNKSKIWYQPNFSIVKPELNSEYELSPFQFEFKNIGKNNFGEDILEGMIIVTLKKYLDQSVKKEIENIGDSLDLNEIPTANIIFQLELIHLETSGATKKSYLYSDNVKNLNDLIKVSFRLTNEWTRLAYGNISMSRGDNKAQIIINYNFEGYSEIKPDTIKLNGGFKLNGMPIQLKTSRSKNELGVKFDLRSKKVITNTGITVAFEKNEKKPVKTGTMIFTPTNLKPVSILNSPLKLKFDVIEKIKKNKKYALQKFGIHHSLELIFPCTDYGEMYRELLNDAKLEVVGCKEPYKLGEVNIPIFEYLEELDHPLYKVYRSTQIPNRFLLEPKEYVISRRSKIQENPYTPNIFLFSTVDAENLDNSNCVLDVLLEPNISVYEIYKLINSLSKYTSYEVKLDLISEILQPGALFNWNIPSSIAQEVLSYPLGIGIRTTISCDISDMMTLKTMLESNVISGSFNLNIPGVGNLKSNLVLSLQKITGPWQEGPLELKSSQNSISVQNKIESPIDVSCIRLIKDDTEKNLVVHQTILPGGNFAVPVESDFDFAYPIYEVKNSTAHINELKNYIEDIECQVILINNVDFEQAELASITIELKLHNDPTIQQIEFQPADEIEEVNFLMPVTDFLSQRIVEYRIKDHNTNWFKHNIAAEGNIINLTSGHLIN